MNRRQKDASSTPRSTGTLKPRIFKSFAKCFLFFLGWMFSAGGIAVYAQQSARPNVLFIAVDDLRTDLGAYGVAHAKTPEIDRLASSARVFRHHYVHVPTCGASRCALMRGKYPSKVAHLSNAAIRNTQADWSAESLPALLRSNGYKTYSLGKITHHPGGLTGKDWAIGPEELPGAWDRAWVPDGPWKSPEAMMHGYANGVARVAGKSPPMQTLDVADDACPDAWVARDAVNMIHQLAQQNQPWFFAVGFFKPHLPFVVPKRWYELHADRVPSLLAEIAKKPDWPSSWHASGEFRGNYGHEGGRDPQTHPMYAKELRQAYAACVSYMDAQVGKVLSALTQNQLADNTIVVLWSDHGFLLGEHAIWGKHCLYEHALKSPLIIRSPRMPAPGASSLSIAETVDVLPTILDLCGLPKPAGLDGHSLVAQINDPNSLSDKPSFSFWNDGIRSVRTSRWRLIEQRKGDQVREELFDYENDPNETRNVAGEKTQVVEQLRMKLASVPEPK